MQISSLPIGLKNIAREDVDNALDEIDKLVEFHQNTFPCKNLTLAEHYLKGEMGAGIVFWPRKCPSREFVAFFERVFPLKICRRGAVNASENGANKVRCYWDNGAMFVENVQTVECPKGVTLTSSVRLQPAQDFFDGILERQLCEAASKPFRRPVYWKRYFAQFNFADRFPGRLTEGETCGQCVESTSEIMDGIADVAAEVYGHILNYMQPVNADSRFTLSISDDLIGLSLGKNVDLTLEVGSVFFGPIKFYSTT
jgi:hypothetical protein